MNDEQSFINDGLLRYLKENGETCWFCKNSIVISGIPIRDCCVIFPMHYKVSSRKISATRREKVWKELNVCIPSCDKCKMRFKGYKFITLLILVLTSLIPIGLILTKQDYLLILLLPVFLIYPIFLQLAYRCYTYLIQLGLESKLGDYYQVKLLKSQGWEYSQVTG